MGNWDHPVYADYAAAVAAAGFPTAALTPLRFVNWATDNAALTSQTLTVPASPYQIQIPAPLPQSSLVITVGGNARTIVNGNAPAAGQVGLDSVTGILTFNAADTGLVATYTVTPLATAVMAGFLHKLQAELQKTQQWALARPDICASRFLPGLADVTPALEWIACIQLDSTRIKTAIVRRVTVEAPPQYATDGMAPDGTTTIQVSDSTAFGSPISVSLAAAATKNTAAGTVSIDVAGGEAIYIRFSAAGGHENLTVSADIFITELPA